MTGQDMVQIMAMWHANWPNATLFQGTADQRRATVTAWLRCCEDLDSGAAEKAAVELCKVNIYPPNIAEFRRAAEKMADIEKRAKSRVKRLKLKRDY